MAEIPTPLPRDSTSERDQKFRDRVFTDRSVTGDTILWPSGVTVKSGWISLAGTAISRTIYADAFAVLGTTYGVGDGSTTFNVANINGSAPSGFIYIMKL